MTKPHNNFAFLFDLDGTLVNTIPLQLNCYKKAFKLFDISISNKDFYLNIGTKNIFNNICKKHNVKVPFWDWYNQKNKIYYKLIDDRLDITPGAFCFIKKIKSLGYSVSIVSSSSEKNINKVLLSTDLFKYIDNIIGAEKTDKGKPFPDPYLAAIKKHKLHPNQCVAFEDTNIGINSAKKAGLFCVAISCFNKDHQKFSDANMIYKDFNGINLYNLIKNLTLRN